MAACALMSSDTMLWCPRCDASISAFIPEKCEGGKRRREGGRKGGKEEGRRGLRRGEVREKREED
jgi:hypothetical protein